MINKDNLIEEILKFINTKIADISSNNPLFDIVAKPYISKVITNNVSKLDKALSLIADDKGMVDADGLLTDMIDRLIVSKANTINGVTIGEGSIKVTIPFMNKTVIFDKDDFKIPLLKAWKDLYCDYTNAFLFRGIYIQSTNFMKKL